MVQHIEFKIDLAKSLLKNCKKKNLINSRTPYIPKSKSKSNFIENSNDNFVTVVLFLM